MPQSLSQVLVHVVFSTKNRVPFLDPEIRDRVHAYLATVGRICGAETSRVGGVEDHVHEACNLPRTLTTSKLVETIKKDSSRWIKTLGRDYRSFRWQAGFGAFSVSSLQLRALITYIDNQEEHHKTQTFQDELRLLLQKYRISYDERYLWD